jgi:putative two-component system response regulator
MNKLLVIDDNLSLLKLMESQLGEKYDITLAKSGMLGLQICTRQRPDLILLDIEMPEMDGFKTMSLLKQNPYLSRIPVIFLSSHHDTAMEVRALKSGAQDFISKPVEKSILLHRIELHLGFSKYQSQLEETVRSLSDSMATSFADLIEFRDEKTGGHVERTAKLAEYLGKEILKRNIFSDEFNNDELEMMIRSAPLHDIGKIAVSDSILLKPGKLTNEEFDAMKRHAAIGGEILEHLYSRTPTQRFLQYAKVIAVSHHEKYDGTGYPYGIAGDNIPLCGRIIALADVYEALTSNRVYRAKMPISEVNAIIMKGKGTHFDPRIEGVFEDIREELEMV